MSHSYSFPDAFGWETTFLSRLYFHNLSRKINKKKKKHIPCIPINFYHPSHSPNQILRNTSLFQWLYLQMINGHLISRSCYITTTPWYVRLVITGGSPWTVDPLRIHERKRNEYQLFLWNSAWRPWRKRLVKFEILCEIAIKPRSD